MANENSESHVKTIGHRVRYIEPNYTSDSRPMQGPRGLHTYEFENPLEDYCIFVNLKVEVRGRAIRTDYTTNSTTYTMNYFSQQGKEAVSFLQGTKYPTAKQNVYGKDVPSLTTDYLDHLYLNDLVKRDANDVVSGTSTTTELFGINSIDIQYNNWMVPEVTIKFTDVRGASLFAAEEARHHLTDSQDVNGNADASVEGSFFKCFFTFPYPKFTLCVKGFYGQPVAYELTCSDFRASFNSDTGNFEATAKFVGYAFSFLGDVMMNALTAAPFSDYLGKTYWEENVANGRFVVKDVNGQEVPMMTIGEIVTKIDSAMNEASGMVASSPEAQEGLQLEQQSNQINNVSTAYQAYTTAVYNCIKNAVEGSNEDAGEFNFAIQDGANLLAFIPDASAGDTFNGATTSLWKPWDENKELDSAFESLQKVAEDKEEYKSKVEKLNFNNLKPIEVYNKDGHYTGNTTLDSFSAIKNGINRNEEISNGKKDGDENLIQRKKLFYAYAFLDNDLSGQLKKDKEQTDAAIQENQAEISEVTNQAIADCLGFNPTVEAITRIIMAHFETLTYMLTMCARDITGQSRTLESLGITTENTKDISSDDKIVPPFPKVTKHVTEEGVEKDEEAWIGDFSGDWLEKDIVNGLLNGINEMAELIKNAASGSTSESGSLTAIMKVPLNPLDMILDKKPYGDINFDDKSDFAGHVVLRMFEILSLNKEFADAEDVSKLGEAEAINFKEFFKNPPQEFKQWLQDEKAVENIINIVKADSTNAPVDKYGKNNKYAWESIKGSATTHRPLIDDWTLNEFKDNSRTYLPVQNASFSKIMRDFGSPDANGNYKYPHTSQDYIISKSSAGINSGGTSVASSSGKLICIEPNPDRFSIIAENQCKNTGVNGELGDLYEKFMDEAKYDADDFCDYIQDGKDFIKVYATSTSDGTSGSTEESSEDDEKEQNTANTSSECTPQDIDDWAEQFNNGLDAFSKDNTHKVDDYRVLFIPAIKPDDSDIEDIDDNAGGVIASNGTLFAQSYYYSRSIEEKAFMYLLSLGYYVDYDKAFDDLFDDDRYFTTAPKASVLFAGCLCYFADKKGTDFEKTFLKMSDDDRIQDLRIDVRNDLASYFKKWVSGDFTKIDSYLSLKVDNTNAFFDDLSDSKGVVYTSDDDIKRIVEKYLPGLSANYGAVDDSIHWIGGQSALGGPSIRLAMKPDSYGALMTTRLVLGSSTFVKTSDVFSDPSETYKIKSGKGEAFLKSFVSKLKDSYLSDSGSTDSAPASTERAADCKTDPDIKIGVYRYLKLLYDKWIAGSVFEEDFTMEKFFENPDKYFYFIDSYYNKIGDLIIINMGKFKDDVLNCETQDGYTLLSFLSQTYSQNKCNFLCIQNFMDLAEPSNLECVFQPVSMMDMNIPDVTPNFIVQYPYETSSHLDLGDEGDYGYPDDSFSISQSPQNTGTGSEANKWPAPLNSGEDVGYYLPAFGVSYGKQYQSYFNNISISMDSPMVTEQAIKAQFEIASRNNENAKNNEGTATRGMITMGQDLFTIYSNNSYTCEIDMMGDAWMQPLMYFELLNIPMFRGTYLIEKVSHHIEAGKMSTHIVGVRMANTTTKIKKGWFWAADPVSTGEDDEENLENQLADVTNDCAYASYPLGGGIGGMLISQNGLSAMNYFEAGNVKWYTGGDEGKNIKDGRGTTCGPGLTGQYLSHGKTASGLRQGFLDALRDHDKRIRKWIKGKKFKQESIDSFYHLDHWGPGLAQSHIPKFQNDNDVCNFWLQQYQTKKGKNYPGWQGFCCGYVWIINNSEPKVNWYDKDQRARAKAGYDMYHSLDKPLLQAMNMSAPPAVNDKTEKNGKTKGIWDDFVASVNQTSQNTPSCGLNVGSVKKGPNQGWLTTGNNGTGGADKLATVFDIVLNAYGEYVQELWWVAKKNQVNQGPDHLELVVSEKPNGNAIKVGMKIAGSNEPYKGVNANTNEKYRRAIVKYYSQDNRHSSKNENEGVYGKVVQSKIPKDDWEKLKPTSCAELMQEAGGGDYSGGGTIDANKKIGRWNVGKACQYAVSHAAPKSKGKCAAYTCNAIEAGGIKAPRQDKAWQIRVNKIPQKQGWSLIKEGTVTKDQNESLNSGRQMGDIGVMGSAQTERPSRPHCYHMAIWTGNEWVSDYRQGKEMVPGNYFKYTPNFPYSIYRYNG